MAAAWVRHTTRLYSTFSRECAMHRVHLFTGATRRYLALENTHFLRLRQPPASCDFRRTALASMTSLQKAAALKPHTTANMCTSDLISMQAFIQRICSSFGINKISETITDLHKPPQNPKSQPTVIGAQLKLTLGPLGSHGTFCVTEEAPKRKDARHAAIALLYSKVNAITELSLIGSGKKAVIGTTQNAESGTKTKAGSVKANSSDSGTGKKAVSVKVNSSDSVTGKKAVSVKVNSTDTGKEKKADVSIGKKADTGTVKKAEIKVSNVSSKKPALVAAPTAVPKQNVAPKNISTLATSAHLSPEKISSMHTFTNRIFSAFGIKKLNETVEDILGPQIRANRQPPVIGARLTLALGPLGSYGTFTAQAEATTRKEARNAALATLFTKLKAINELSNIGDGTKSAAKIQVAQPEGAISVSVSFSPLVSDSITRSLAVLSEKNVFEDCAMNASNALHDTQDAAMGTYQSYNSINSSIPREMRLPTPSMRATSLPIGALGERILRTIAENDVTVISAATGSGKTTQIPQFIADALDAHVLVTQPRRVAAITVAERVASERGLVHRVPLAGKTVGFSVRFRKSHPRRISGVPGTILFCTVGVLLRRIQSGADALRGVTHIILDEVHERDVGTDMLLMLVRDRLSLRNCAAENPLDSTQSIMHTEDLEHTAKNKPLGDRSRSTVPKLVLMSATMGDPERLASYFATQGLSVGSILDVEGKHYPVEGLTLAPVLNMLPASARARLGSATQKYIAHELEISPAKEQLQNVPVDLVTETVAHIAATEEEGAILAFLPGWEEISSVHRSLLVHPSFTALSPPPRVFLLHSSVPHGSGDAAFQPSPPGSGRKIVLSTNIAESSVTIPDAVHVVDCGRHRIMRYDARQRMSALACEWISRANVRQRMGRAGRCRPGKYYALYGARRLVINTVNQGIIDSHSQENGPLRTSSVAVSAVNSTLGNAKSSVFGKLLCLNYDGTFYAQTAPEVQRLALEDVCLSAIASGCDAREPDGSDLLAGLLDAPSAEKTACAISVLLRLGAVKMGYTENEKLTDKRAPRHGITLTPLGTVLANLPVHPALGKMLVVAALVGVLDPVLSAVSAMGGGIFIRSQHIEVREARLRAISTPWCASHHSDQLVAHNLWRACTHGARFAADAQNANAPPADVLAMVSGQSVGRISETRESLRMALRDAGFSFGHAIDNRNADVDGLVRTVLALGLYPNVAVRKAQADSSGKTFRSATVSRVHPASTSAGRTALHLPSNVQSLFGDRHVNSAKAAGANAPLVYVYEELSEVDGRRSISQMTAIDPATMALLCGKAVATADGLQLCIDGLVNLKPTAEQPHAVRMLTEIKGHWECGLHFLVSRRLARVRAHSDVQSGNISARRDGSGDAGMPVSRDKWLSINFELDDHELRAADALLGAFESLSGALTVFRK